MLIGLFIVKPIPPNSHAAIEGYNSVPNTDSIVFVEEAQVVVDPEAAAEAETDSMPLLEYEQESGSYRVPLSPSVVELNASANLHCERGAGEKDWLPDIHGKRLWLSPDFYLIFLIKAICA